MLPENTGWKDWHVPLRDGQHSLVEVLESSKQVAANQEDVPLIVKLVENPAYHIPGFTLFNGAVDLHDHDCIHALLGRGLLSKDEAFTIGFTMGSTGKVSSTESWLYSFAAKHLYPDAYRFDEEDIAVFNDAVHLGHVSDCVELNRINFRTYYDLPLDEIRRRIGLETDLLEAYYRIEQRRYPDSPASQRLL